MRVRLAAPAACGVLMVLWAGCANSDGGSDPRAAGVALELVVDGLSAPTALAARGGDARLFIVEQGGRIRIVQDGRLRATPFLDITNQVASGGERGLLSVAFHPEYASNGFFYVDYTDKSGDTRVERYTVSAADPDAADPASGVLILAQAQPYPNHNGGQLAFGPDGMLYVAFGDGGSGGDPMGNGQKLTTLLGKILRVDVDGGTPYAIPPDNPFVGSGQAREEIWAFGLRNPWRFSFDPPSGMLYIGDVGQNAWEEIDAVPMDAGGINFGWNVMEAAHCYGAASCDATGLTLPVLEYPTTGSSCAVLGGYVYRGTALPALTGQYFYSDYCGGFVHSFTLVDGQAAEPTAWNVAAVGQVLSMGRDAAGELYLLGQDGRVWKLVSAP